IAESAHFDPESSFDMVPAVADARPSQAPIIDAPSTTGQGTLPASTISVNVNAGPRRIAGIVVTVASAAAAAVLGWSAVASRHRSHETPPASSVEPPAQQPTAEQTSGASPAGSQIADPAPEPPPLPVTASAASAASAAPAATSSAGRPPAGST